MNQLRRALALFLVFLAIPSIVWVSTRPFIPTSGEPVWHSPAWWLGWSAEFFFVLCCLGIAVAAWRQFRLWPFALLAFAAYESIIATGPLVKSVLFVAPVTYVNAVLKEAGERGVANGPSLVWSLLVLPFVFPVLSVVAAWLCVVARGKSRAA